MAGIEELLALPLPALKAQLLNPENALPRGVLEALERDTRRGALALARQVRTYHEARRNEAQRLRFILKHERELRDKGFSQIAGVDEAGIGPMAGPVIAGAVILPDDYQLRELDDSKRLDETKREQLAAHIKRDALAWSVGIAEVSEIDRINVYHAGLLAMRRAVNNLHRTPDFVLVDARTIPGLKQPQRGIIKGDQLSASIAAASIIAKTTRDALMFELDQQYPGYGLAAHKGYATAEHFKALRAHGVLPIHRRSYRPIREALGLEPMQAGLFE